MHFCVWSGVLSFTSITITVTSTLVGPCCKIPGCRWMQSWTWGPRPEDERTNRQIFFGRCKSQSCLVCHCQNIHYEKRHSGFQLVPRLNNTFLPERNCRKSEYWLWIWQLCFLCPSPLLFLRSPNVRRGQRDRGSTPLYFLAPPPPQEGQGMLSVVLVVVNNFLAHLFCFFLDKTCLRH